MKKLIIIFYMVLPFIAAAQVNIDSILTELKNEIKTRPERFEKKEHRLEVLKSVGSRRDDKTVKFNRLLDICNEYSVYQADSTRSYAEKMLTLSREMNDPDAIAMSVTSLAHSYLTEGFFKEACELVESVDTTGVSPWVMSRFLSMECQLYRSLVSYVEEAPNLVERYDREFNKALSLVPVYARLTNDSIHAERMNFINPAYGTDAAKSIDIINKYIGKYDLNDAELAVQYYILSEKTHLLGQIDSTIYYLAKSAIHDIRGNVRETRSTTTLAERLYEQGDLESASFFMAIAKEDADFYNSTPRKMEIDRINIKIENARLIESERQHLYSGFIVSFIGLSLIIFIFVVILLRRKNRKLTAMHADSETKSHLLDEANSELSKLNNSLKQVNEIKNQYIVKSICTDHTFVNLVEERVRNLDRKIAARQYSSLGNELRTLNIRQEHRRIASEFDSGFLSLFPNFLADFNKLFPPGQGYNFTEEGFLPGEVRIYGLMRLGIEDTALVSKYLNISLNTIYVYKARVKARTIVPKDEFERYVMEIPQM